MKPARSLSRWQIVAAAGALGLAALASATAIAQSRPAGPTAAVRAPLRAMFYVTAPARIVAQVTGRPVPRAGAMIESHLNALAWAWADAAIVPWSKAGSAADRKLAAVLAAISSTHRRVRVAALIDHPQGSERAQLQALAMSRASARAYLKIGSRPAVFVAPAIAASRSCTKARRWRAAASGFWLAQSIFPGYGRCRDAADSWFRDDAGARSTRSAGTFLIRPGAWPSGAGEPTVARSIEEWQRSIDRMNASGAQLQLVDSLNDWGSGTATEPSSAWSSPSGFGAYLDALHARRPGVAPGDTMPAVDAVAISALTAHAASLTATLTAGSQVAAWHVEFGTTAAYGQETPPAALAAGLTATPVTFPLSGLSAKTTYHARIVISSPVGMAASSDASFTTSSDARVYRVAAAGDIACDPASGSFNGGAGTTIACHQQAVSSAILAGGYDTVLPLGDLQYESGAASAFQASYAPSWGRLKAITRPAVGNHEYGTPGATPYYDYFGSSAGDPATGYYSYELGAWHLIALNSNCTQVPGGCAAGSPQELWLRADLAAHPARCTLAYWHHPRFSSGQQGDNGFMSPMWQDLAAAGAELVLSGHDHDYERFAPQDGQGDPDVDGIREFVVGTGGKNHMTFKTVKENSELRDTSSFGFLDLELGDGTYAWNFVSDPPGGLADRGSGTCH